MTHPQLLEQVLEIGPALQCAAALALRDGRSAMETGDVVRGIVQTAPGEMARLLGSRAALEDVVGMALEDILLGPANGRPEGCPPDIRVCPPDALVEAMELVTSLKGKTTNAIDLVAACLWVDNSAVDWLRRRLGARKADAFCEAVWAKLWGERALRRLAFLRYLVKEKGLAV